MTSASQYRITDIFSIIFTFLVCIFLYLQEKENNLFALIKACKNGRLKAIWAKLITVGILSGTFTLLIYSSTLIVSAIICGFGYTARYIQSMAYYGGSNILISVKQYMALFLLSKLLVILLITLIFLLLFSVLNSKIEIYLSIAGIIAGNYMAHRYIDRLSAFNLFKYINLFAFLDTDGLYSKYNNISLFGFPVNRTIASIATMICLITLISIILSMIFIKQRRLIGINYFAGLEKCIKKIIYRYFASSNLVWHGTYKMLFINRGVLILLLLLCIANNSIIKELPEFTIKEKIYASYLEKLEGPLNEGKEAFIRNERKKFDDIPFILLDMDDKLDRGEISRAEYEAEEMRLGGFGSRLEAFEEIERQYKYLKSLEERGIKASYINVNHSDYIFHRSKRDKKIAFCFWLCL